MGSNSIANLLGLNAFVVKVIFVNFFFFFLNFIKMHKGVIHRRETPNLKKRKDIFIFYTKGGD